MILFNDGLEKGQHFRTFKFKKENTYRMTMSQFLYNIL